MVNIIAFIVGAFVGWNMPQPQLMKDWQVKFMTWFKKTS